MIELFATVTDVIVIALEMLLSMIVVLYFAIKIQIKKIFALFLYIYHTFFSIFYAIFSLSNPADSRSYYLNSLNIDKDFSLGSNMVVYFSHFFTNFLELSYLGLFMVFNLIGLLGILFMYAAFQKALKYNSKFYKYATILFIFLPTLHFWSSAPGKDSVAMLATGLFIYSASLNFKQYKIIVLSLFLMLLVRPHIYLVMQLSIFFVLLNNLSTVKKFLFTMLFFMGSYFMLEIVLRYVGIELFQYQVLIDYITHREGENTQGGSSFNLSETPLYFRPVIFLFFPIYDMSSLFKIEASFENIIMLLFFLQVPFLYFKKRVVTSKALIINALYYYVAIITIALSFTIANLGIASRQKWMIIPVLFYLLILSKGRTNERIH
jgi:hypothetical protein